jgi:prepilin-type N-terminal cleavage/methylation domain-containing protein
MRSVICPRAEGGFTLIELVVALAVVGLILTVTLPRMSGWLDRFGFASKEQRVHDSLAGLAETARRAGRTMYLRSSDQSAKSSDSPAIELPSGWTLTVEPPIVFRYDGVCAGGTARVTFPDGELTYRLDPPFCHPQPL